MTYLEKLQAKAKRDGYALKAEYQIAQPAAFNAIHPDVVKMVLMTVKPVIKAVKHEKPKPQDQPDNAVPVNLNGHRLHGEK